MLLASRFSLLASRFSLLASRFSLLASRFSLLALIFMIGSTARGQAPVLDTAVCSSQETVARVGSTYDIKGNGTAINMPAGTSNVKFTIVFQSKVGNNNWVNVSTHIINTAPVNGTATFDTGWKPITPAVGEQYRFSLDAVRTTNGTDTALLGIGSNTVIPRP
jgi:hypothetical protein